MKVLRCEILHHVGVAAAASSKTPSAEGNHHANVDHRHDGSRSPIPIGGMAQSPSQGTASIPDFSGIWHTYDHEFRQVRMNQPHLPQATPSWYGDSVGHYEGDTLIIDTVGIRIGPFAMVDQYGSPCGGTLSTA
jgi:hypothetical protein